MAWGPWYGDQRELPVNPNIGVRTWESSEAVTVSDDGMVIGGNNYYTLPGSGFLSLPCIWQWSVTDGDYRMTLLEDLQGGKRHATHNAPASVRHANNQKAPGQPHHSAACPAKKRPENPPMTLPAT